MKVYRGDKSNGYEEFPFELQDITSIRLDRRWNMAADELEIELSNMNGYYSPDYSVNKQYTNLKELSLSGYKDVIHAYNRVEVDLGYGNQLIRCFTGQIQDINITENPPTIKFNALNSYRKLLKPIDPAATKALIYPAESKAFDIIKDLCQRAGINDLLFDNESINNNDFMIDTEVKFELGTNYSDAIKDILSIMNHRIVGGRNGEIEVLVKELYSQQDFHNWEFDDYENLTEGNYKIDTSVIRNRVVVQSEDGWQAFEDKWLIEYCNGEVISTGVEVLWAATPEQKWAVADDYFMQMRRKLRRISVAVVGNPAMDVGDLVKCKMLTSTANAKYMITAIQSEFTEQGYIDIVDLEFVSAVNGHICEMAEGEYANVGRTGAAVVSMNLREQIVDYAKALLGTYYQWGGNCVENSAHYGLDCSHFTYTVLKKFGFMDTYRVAKDQKEWCTPITKEELEIGDLCFYTAGGSTVTHVVMYIGNGQIIGANGGGKTTTTKVIARDKGAMVKIQNIDYRGSPAYYGRVPNLEV